MSDFVMGARLTLRDQFSSQVSQATRATQAFHSTTQRASQSSNLFRDANGRARDSLGRYTREGNNATATTRTWISANGKLNSSFGLVARGIGAASAAFGAFAAKRWLIDSNADMETYKNTLSVVLGSQEKAVQQLAWAQKFAATTPFEIPQIIEATTRMASYGLNAQKTLGVVGDMASVMGKDLMQAVEAVADAQTGEVERLKEFGITKDMIAQQAKLMNVTAVNAKGQIVDQKAFNAALFTLMEKRYAGGMAIQAKSFKGMISNVQDFVGTVGRKLGEPIFAALSVQLAGLLDWLNKLQSDGTIDKWIANITTSVATGMQYMGEAVGFIRDNWGTIAPVVTGLAAAFATYTVATKAAALASKAMGIQTKIMGVIAEAGSVKMALLNAVMALNPVTLVIIAIAALVGILVYAAYKSEAFRQVLLNAWSSIVTFVMPAVTAVKAAILGAFNAIMAWTTAYWPKIQAIIGFVWSFLGPYITTWLDFIKLAITNAFSVVLSIVKGTWGMVTAVIETAWTVISNVVGFWLNLLTGDFKGAGQNIINIFTGMGQGILKFFGSLGTMLFESGGKIMETLAAGIKAAVMAPVNAVKGVFEKVRSMLPFSDAKEGPFSQLTHNGGKIMTTLGEGVQSKASALYGAMADVFGSAPLPTLSVGTRFDDAAPPTFSSSHGVTADVNPAGKTTATTVTRTTKIEKLIDKLELHDVGNKDPKTLVEELIELLYDKLSGADDVLSDAEMGALL